MAYLTDQKTKGVADLTTRHLDANASGSSGARSRAMGYTLSGNPVCDDKSRRK